ncbi:hypothetical protein [Rhodoblastus sp.]|uniref:hypothetical protein n=1 Tax=Rhodoblastus sp. TaxID=1962975 RepID=UPI002601EF76|nr:hypothetical protein [Rhodoblastus sp.]
MKHRRIAPALAAVAAVYYLSGGVADAQTSEVLHEITATADRLCGFVSQFGDKKAIKVNGDVTAELSGLAKRLANLGVKGVGTLESSQYEGVVQAQLSGALKDVRDCKLKVFNVLQDKLIAVEHAPGIQRNPNDLYQYGEVVGQVQGAVISQANGTVTFLSVRTSGNANPSKAVEYQDWVLHCPDLPTPPPNANVGLFIGMVQGESCAIVGKIN